MTISILSSVPYAFLRQRPHQLAHEFCRAGMDVIFIDPPGNCLRTMLQRARSSSSRIRSPGLRRVSLQSLRLPGLNLPLWPTNANDRACRETLTRRVFAHPPSRPHALIVTDPLHEVLIPDSAVDLLCYDCVDDPALFVAAHGSSFYDHRDRLVRRSAILFATAERLEEGLRRTYPASTVLRVPNGVDPEWFQQHGVAADPRLDATMPIVGYVGALYEWLDSELLLEVARRLPEVRFALVGPLRGLKRASDLRAAPNIVVMGPVPYERVPGIIAGFAVGMIPFTEGPLADSTDPIKLYEYFALGKPVVATRMHQLSRFANAGLLRCSSHAGEFAQNILAYLQSDPVAVQAARRSVAEEHSWKRSAETIIHALQRYGT